MKENVIAHTVHNVEVHKTTHIHIKIISYIHNTHSLKTGSDKEKMTDSYNGSCFSLGSHSQSLIAEALPRRTQKVGTSAGLWRVRGLVCRLHLAWLSLPSTN